MRTVLLISTLAIGFCGQPQPFEPDLEAALGDSFILRVGQSAVVSGTSLHLRFEEVLEDSRCPSDVACVWAGNARVRLLVAEEQDELIPIHLNTGLDPSAVSTLGYEIRLEELQPAPTTTTTVPPGDYMATLRVTRSP